LIVEGVGENILQKQLFAIDFAINKLKPIAGSKGGILGFSQKEIEDAKAALEDLIATRAKLLTHTEKQIPGASAEKKTQFPGIPDQAELEKQRKLI